LAFNLRTTAKAVAAAMMVTPSKVKMMITGIFHGSDDSAPLPLAFPLGEGVGVGEDSGTLHCPEVAL
jgi:hypothetical protein